MSLQTWPNRTGLVPITDGSRMNDTILSQTGSSRMEAFLADAPTVDVPVNFKRCVDRNGEMFAFWGNF